MFQKWEGVMCWEINRRCEQCRFIKYWDDDVTCKVNHDEYMATEEELKEIPEMCDQDGEPLECPMFKYKIEKDDYYYEEWER